MLLVDVVDVWNGSKTSDISLVIFFSGESGDGISSENHTSSSSSVSSQRRNAIELMGHEIIGDRKQKKSAGNCCWIWKQ